MATISTAPTTAPSTVFAITPGTVFAITPGTATSIMNINAVGDSPTANCDAARVGPTTHRECPIGLTTGCLGGYI